MAVFVLDKHKRPLSPSTKRRARKMLEAGRARVHGVMPFVDRTVAESEVHPLVVKVNPGSKGTGVALVREKPRGGDDAPGPATHVILKAELRHRADTMTAWVARGMRWAPVARTDMELVRFDTQLLQNPEISGVEYQQCELHGYEVRECVLERMGRWCAYRGKTDLPLQLDHVVPKARGGSDRVSNPVPACERCNQAKDDRPVEVFLRRRPDVLAQIRAGLRAPLRDAAAVNATRHALRCSLEGLGLPVTCWSGGRTKWNRCPNGIPKAHAIDAACVGEVGTASGWERPTLVVRCTGRGSYGRQNVDAHGVARGAVKVRSVEGFRTGDHVKAVVPKGKHQGTWWGRVAVRSYGAFGLEAGDVRIDVMPAHFCLLQSADGYGYAHRPMTEAPRRDVSRALLPALKGRASAPTRQGKGPSFDASRHLLPASDHQHGSTHRPDPGIPRSSSPAVQAAFGWSVSCLAWATSPLLPLQAGELLPLAFRHAQQSNDGPVRHDDGIDGVDVDADLGACVGILGGLHADRQLDEHADVPGVG